MSNSESQTNDRGSWAPPRAGLEVERCNRWEVVRHGTFAGLSAGFALGLVEIVASTALQSDCSHLKPSGFQLAQSCQALAAASRPRSQGSITASAGSQVPSSSVGERVGITGRPIRRTAAECDLQRPRLAGRGDCAAFPVRQSALPLRTGRSAMLRAMRPLSLAPSSREAGTDGTPLLAR